MDYIISVLIQTKESLRFNLASLLKEQVEWYRPSAFDSLRKARHFIWFPSLSDYGHSNNSHGDENCHHLAKIYSLMAKNSSKEKGENPRSRSQNGGAYNTCIREC